MWAPPRPRPRHEARRAGPFLGLTLAAPASAAEQDLRARPGGSFGHAVAAAGHTLVVGDPDAGEKGAVYVFQRTGDVWTQTAKLTAADGAPGDALGWSVAVSGATVVSGAPSNGDGKGAVYTFAPTGADGYAQAAKLAATDGAPGDHLGLAVAIEADTIVAGAPHDAPDASAAEGAVYTFASAGEPARTETAKLTATVAAAGDQVGSSVAISGETVVAGAPGGVVGRGAVYTFARAGAPVRTQTATVTASDGGPGERLGASGAVQGDTIVAGAPDVYAGPRDNHGTRVPRPPSSRPAAEPRGTPSARSARGGDRRRHRAHGQPGAWHGRGVLFAARARSQEGAPPSSHVRTDRPRLP
jgi:hypothetical protein